MIFSSHYGQQQNGKKKKGRRIISDFDCHVDGAVRRGAQHPIKHNQGFLRSHWMPPSGECLCRIAPAAAIVDKFGRKHITLTKNYFKLANLR